MAMKRVPPAESHDAYVAALDGWRRPRRDERTPFVIPE